jgi:hypothetical protein
VKQDMSQMETICFHLQGSLTLRFITMRVSFLIQSAISSTKGMIDTVRKKATYILSSGISLISNIYSPNLQKPTVPLRHGHRIVIAQMHGPSRALFPNLHSPAVPTSTTASLAPCPA